MNQGILLYKSGRLSEANTALVQALDTTNLPAKLGEIRYTLALIELAKENRSGALEHLRSASKYGHAAARDLSERMRSGR